MGLDDLYDRILFFSQARLAERENVAAEKRKSLQSDRRDLRRQVISIHLDYKYLLGR